MGFLTALKIGNRLKDPELYKIAMLFLNLIISIIAVMGVLLPEIDEKLLIKSLVTVTISLAALNNYFTVATTNKIGLPDKATPNH